MSNRIFSLLYLLILREFDKKSKLNEKLKKKFEDFEKEDIHVREGIKHAQEQIKKLKKNIDTETEKVRISFSFIKIFF